MSTKYEYRVSTPGVVGGRKVINNDGFIALASDNTTDPSAAGQIAYVAGTGFRAYGANGVITLGSGGSGSGSSGLDGAYANGQSITLNQGPITLTDATAAALNSLTLTKSGAGSGNVLDLNLNAVVTGNAIDIDMDLALAAKGIYIDCGGGARTGSDISVNDDSTGTHSIISIASSGSGPSTGFSWTDSYAGSDASFGAKLTLNNSAGLDATAIQIVRGTGVRTVPALDINDASTGNADIIDVDLTGVYTGDVMSFTSSAAATGNVWHATMTNAVAMTALRVEGAGARTQPFIELIGTQTGTASMIDISCDGAFTGKALDIDLTTAVGAIGLLWTTAGARTAAIETVTLAGTFSATLGGTYLDLNVSQTGASASALFDIDLTAIYTGNIFDFATSAASTGTVLELNMTTAVAAKCLNITNAGTRTADLITITDSSAGAVDMFQITSTSTSSGHIFNIDVDSIFTGNVFDVTFGTAAATGEVINITMGTNVAGSAIVLSGAGARTDDLIKIDDASTGSAHIFDINLTAAYTGNILDISTGNTTVAAVPLQIARGTGTNTGASIKIDDTGTTSAPGIDMNYSGIATGAALDITYATAAATAQAIKLSMGTNVAGDAIYVSSAATGVTGHGMALGVAHTGDLVAGADVVRIATTGNISSTSNVLSVRQSTGAGTAGAYGVYISCTGTNVEALKVDDGNVVFDENLTVTGTSTLAGAMTHKAATRSATTDGATFSLTAADSGSIIRMDRAAGAIYTLPAPAVGLKFTFDYVVTVTSNAYTIVTDAGSTYVMGSIISIDTDSSNVTVGFVGNGTSHIKVSSNGTTTGGLLGSRLTVECVSATQWLVSGYMQGTGVVATPFST